jgi:ABC-type transport system substrate-binding protein
MAWINVEQDLRGRTDASTEGRGTAPLKREATPAVRSRYGILAVTLTVMLVASACGTVASPSPTGAVPSGPAASAGASPAAPSGQIELARVALSGAVNQFNNCQAQASPDAQAMGLLAGFLFRWDRDGELVPELASSIEPSADGLTWTVKLNPDAEYSDGTPVTADDVAYQFERCKDAPTTYKVFINTITSVQATDPTTVVYTMSQPNLLFPEFFGFWFAAIWPKAQVSANEEEFFKHPIGAGPYVLTSGTIGDPKLVYDENPNYILGPRAIKRIELNVVPDITSRALQLTQGQLDYVYQLPPIAKTLDTPGIEKWTHNPGSAYRVNFNQGLPADHPLRNRDVRQAISLAIDREQIASKAFFGLNKPAQGDAPSVFGDDVVANYPNGGRRDVEAAKAKLAGTPFSNGFAFTLTVAGSERPGYVDAALIIKENLKDLSIDVTVDGVTVGVAFDRMPKGEYEATFSNHGGGAPLLSWWSNDYTPTGFWGNNTKYNNPAMTQLLNDITVQTDAATTKELWRQAQELAYNDPTWGLSVMTITDDSGHLSGSRLSRDLIGAVLGRDPFYVAAAGTAQ